VSLHWKGSRHQDQQASSPEQVCASPDPKATDSQTSTTASQPHLLHQALPPERRVPLSLQLSWCTPRCSGRKEVRCPAMLSLQQATACWTMPWTKATHRCLQHTTTDASQESTDDAQPQATRKREALYRHSRSSTKNCDSQHQYVVSVVHVIAVLYCFYRCRCN